mgnify:FL=1
MLYVGTVKRKNIGFDIRQLTLEEGETYDKGKQRVISERVENFLDGHKTLLYYPFAGGIDMRIKPGYVLPTGVWWLLIMARKTKNRKPLLYKNLRKA